MVIAWALAAILAGSTDPGLQHSKKERRVVRTYGKVEGVVEALRSGPDAFRVRALRQVQKDRDLRADSVVKEELLLALQGVAKRPQPKDEGEGEYYVTLFDVACRLQDPLFEEPLLSIAVSAPFQGDPIGRSLAAWGSTRPEVLLRRLSETLDSKTPGSHTWNLASALGELAAGEIPEGLRIDLVPLARRMLEDPDYMVRASALGLALALGDEELRRVISEWGDNSKTITGLTAKDDAELVRQQGAVSRRSKTLLNKKASPTPSGGG